MNNKRQWEIRIRMSSVPMSLTEEIYVNVKRLVQRGIIFRGGGVNMRT